jgi:hypothetical protein
VRATTYPAVSPVCPVEMPRIDNRSKNGIKRNVREKEIEKR